MIELLRDLWKPVGWALYYGGAYLGWVACGIMFICTAWLPILLDEWGGRCDDAIRKLEGGEVCEQAKSR